MAGLVSRKQTVASMSAGVKIGGGAPIVVQSMTNTDTADIESTVRQIAALHRAGSELVRITVDRDEGRRRRTPYPRTARKTRRFRADHRRLPLYRPQAFDRSPPACAEALAKYRINPGNVGFKSRSGDVQFSTHDRDGDEIRQAGAHRRELGSAWTRNCWPRLMDENAKSQPIPRKAKRGAWSEAHGAVRAVERPARRGSRTGAAIKIILSTAR